jgi:heme-degrading monooxygenase HmoA
MSPPQPPYYAVIFSSRRTGSDASYAETAELMERLAHEQPGYLGIESVHSESEEGITVSYWASREAIAAWKAHVKHRVAQDRGRQEWYESFTLRICRVDEVRFWESGASPEAATRPFMGGRIPADCRSCEADLRESAGKVATTFTKPPGIGLDHRQVGCNNSPAGPMGLDVLSMLVAGVL